MRKLTKKLWYMKALGSQEITSVHWSSLSPNPSVLRNIIKFFLITKKKKTEIPSRSNSSRPETYERNEYLSTVLRLKELRSLGEDSSVITGRETIPKARSISSTTISMNSIDKTSVNVDHFLLCNRPYLPFAIVEWARNPTVILMQQRATSI